MVLRSSYVNASAAPMFPFCHGLGFANLSMALSINRSTASMGDTVSAAVAISRHDNMDIAQVSPSFLPALSQSLFLFLPRLLPSCISASLL